METIDPTKYTVLQLKRWLNKLDLPTGGTKNALASRINTVPAEERGECPLFDEAVGGEGDEEERCEVFDMQMELMKKELELIKKERDLLQRENDLLKQTADFEKTTENVSEHSVEEQSIKTFDNISFGVLRECLPDFDGNGNFDLFACQLKNVVEAYSVDSRMMRALLISKLKGKALQWLQSKSNYASETAENLLEQMKELFGSKEGKLLMRRNFEGRRWKYGATFTEYFNEKIIMANQIKLDEEELIDCLIDGIPDEQLRTQALMQNFSNKLQLQQSFCKITLVRKSTQQTKQLNKENVRCFNCNSLGHYAADCKKPRREPGTCYGCGSTQHLVAGCPKRKDGAIHMLDEENYNAY